MMRKYLSFGILIVLAVFGLIFGLEKLKNKSPTPQAPAPASVIPSQTSPAVENPSSSTQNTESPQGQIVEVIADFKARITKKTFGQYITPQNSPVQPERFTGYHTGVDVEYQDIATDVSVYTIADGRIVLSETASGYGGVFMMEFSFDGQTYAALYGHIRPSSLPKTGTEYKKGQQIAVLGTGYSKETDNERRHLHFGILKGSSTNIKGYVSTQSQLSPWIDPLSLY